MKRKILSMLFACMFLPVLAACDISAPAPTPPTPEEPVKQSELVNFKLSYEDFKNKMVVFYGDSIAYGATLGAGELPYPQILASEWEFEVYNYAVSSSALTNDRFVPSGVRIIGEHPNENRDADIAVIAYGANDFQATNYASELGTPQDDPKALSEVKTFYGAIRFAVRTLREKNPDLRILFMTPLFRGDGVTVNQLGLTLDAYADAIKGLAEELGYRAIDLYPVFVGKEFGTQSKYSKDAIHPNAAGQRLLAEYIMAYDEAEQ